MDIKIKIVDDENRDVIIEDAGFNREHVRITIGDKTSCIKGEEIMEAVKRCLNARWPY